MKPLMAISNGGNGLTLAIPDAKIAPWPIWCPCLVKSIVCKTNLAHATHVSLKMPGILLGTKKQNGLARRY